MLEIIPAIDLIENRCVRLTQGDYKKQIVFEKSPLAIAQEFEDLGFTRLHIVDLEGAKKQKITHWNILESIATKTKLKIDFSGGIRTLEDVQRILNTGAKYVTLGSLAIKKPELILEWAKTIGNENIILACDTKNKKLQLYGWEQEAEWTIEDFIAYYYKQGLQHFLSTDISKDGMMQGISKDYYLSLLNKFPNIQLVASGGVSNVEDLETLEDIGCSGAIVGKSLLMKTIDIKAIQKKFLVC